MTISKQYAPTRTVGNGATTEFTANWRVTDETDLDVYLIDTGATTNKTLQTITTEYTVTINDTTETATVTFITAPPATKDVILEQTVAETQPTNIPDVATIRENTLETAYDRNTRLIQQLSEKLGRQFQATVEDNTNLTYDFELPTPVDNTPLFWSVSGSSASLVNSTTDLSDLDTAVANSTSNANISTSNANISTSNANTSTANASTASAAVSLITGSNNVEWEVISNTTLSMAAGASFKGTQGNVFSFASGKTLDISATPGSAGALASGNTEQSSTLYYLLAIGDTSASNTPALLGVEEANYAAFTTSDLPSGYDDYKRLPGWFYNDSGSDLSTYLYREGKLWNGLNADSNISYSGVAYGDFDYSSIVPSVITNVNFYISKSATTTADWRIKGTARDLPLWAFSTTNADKYVTMLLNSSGIVELRVGSSSLALNFVYAEDSGEVEGQ